MRLLIRFPVIIRLCLALLGTFECFAQFPLICLAKYRVMLYFGQGCQMLSTALLEGTI